jgi:hypothetical protein
MIVDELNFDQGIFECLYYYIWTHLKTFVMSSFKDPLVMASTVGVLHSWKKWATGYISATETHPGS